MGKGDRRKKPKPAKKLPGLKATPRREPNGRAARGGEHDPRRGALDARCRRMGIEPNRENRKRMGAPHMSMQIGMALELTFERDEVDRLWGVLKNWLRAEWIYRSRILGQREYPKTAAIQMIHERFEVDLSQAPDLRSEEDKDKDAANMWMRWQGCLGHLSRDQRALLEHVKHDREGLWNEEEISEKGEAAVMALQFFADVVEERLT